MSGLCLAVGLHFVNLPQSKAARLHGKLSEYHNSYLTDLDNSERLYHTLRDPYRLVSKFIVTRSYTIINRKNSYSPDW
jgi:hypothetical protein